MASQVSPLSTVVNVAQAAATVAASTVLRASPAPAPNGMPRWLAKVLTHTAMIAVLPTLPLAVAAHAISQPPQPLKVALIAHLLRNTASIAPVLEECYSEADAADVEYHRAAVRPFPKGLWDDVKCEIVSVPPAPSNWAPLQAVEIPGAVTTAPRPGFMFTPVPRRPKEPLSRQLIIHTHGGGYVRGHPLWTPFAPKLARDTRTPMLSVQYRKCVTESTAYPAPLLDALSAYHYATTTLGYAPSDIVLVGESAGGNLALAVMQVLSSTGQPLPRGLALSSPWCDMTFSFPSIWHNSYVDYLALNAGKSVVASVARHYTTTAIRGALLSPALAPAGTWTALAPKEKREGTRVFVQVGTGEGMHDEAIALAGAMRADGVRVEVDEEVGGLHCGALTLFMGEDAYHKFAEGTERLLRPSGRRRESESMNIGEVAEKALRLL